MQWKYTQGFLPKYLPNTPKLLMSVVELDSRSVIRNRKYLVDTYLKAVALAAPACIKMTYNSIFGDVRNGEQRGDLCRVLSDAVGPK